MKGLLARWQRSFPGRLVAKMGEDNAFNWAVIIAWNALFSIFPIVLLMAAIAGMIFGLVGINSAGLYRTVASIFPNDYGAQQQVIGALQGFRYQGGLFFAVGLAGLAWSGAALFGAMEQAFAVIYHSAQRSFIRSKLVAMFMVVVLVVFGGLTVLSSALLGMLSQVPVLPGLLHAGPVAWAIQAVGGIVAGFVLFLAFYWFVPNRPQQLRKVWPGALVAGVLFEALTLLFPLYAQLAKVGAAYGKVFGLLFLLLTFMYFLGLVTMLGVEMNSLLYPVPVEQPGGDAVLPVAGREAGGAKRSPRAVRVDLGPGNRPELPAHRKAQPVKALVGLALVGLTGVLRRRRGRGRVA